MDKWGGFQMNTALIYDAVYLFAAALERLDIAMVEVTSLDCDSEDTWKHRSSLINFMKDVSLSSNFSFLDNFYIF